MADTHRRSSRAVNPYVTVFGNFRIYYFAFPRTLTVTWRREQNKNVIKAKKFQIAPRFENRTQ
jgi:hypothetical protein